MKCLPLRFCRNVQKIQKGDPKVENLDKLVRQLCMYPDETPWLEFKHNNYDPQMIGEDISALANGATLDEKNCAYFL